MAEGRTVHGAAQTRLDDRRLLWLPLACVYPLMVLTFQFPGRESPNSADALDAIALIKVGSRGALLAILVFVLCRLWRHSRRPAVMRCLLPFAAFVFWAVLSTLWSPLRAFSLGQAGTLLLLLVLAAVLGVLRSGPLETSAILCHLSTALLLINAALLAIHLVAPDTSGFVREKFGGTVGAGSFVHPTASGATASLATIVLVAARLLWGWRWTRILLVPGLLIHAAVLFLAASRIALFLALSVTVVACCALVNRLALAGVLVAVSAAGAGYLIMDPGLELVEDVLHHTDSYVRRGESEEEITSLTGRTYLWREVLESFSESPVYGHGYFVTSKDGLLNVREWYRPATNRTAHNLFLQILVSTGVVGFLLFVWGLMRPVLMGIHHFRRDQGGRRLGILLALAGGWYLGSGLLGESFLGPLLPESVVFFTLLGLALGNLPLPTVEQAPARPEGALSLPASTPTTSPSRPRIAEGRP